MESLRRRLTALRSEESDLLAKVGELNSQIKQSREEHDKLQTDIHCLRSTETLLKQKLDTQNLRLQETEKSFSVHQDLLHSQGSLITGHEDYYSREDDLKVELDKKKEEARLLDISLNEAVLRNQHLETLRQKSNSRAAELEKQLEVLQEQYSCLTLDHTSISYPYSQDSALEDLEASLMEVKQRLETVNNRVEASEREVSRLNRLIDKTKLDLDKQQCANELLKKEFDGIFSDLASI